MVTAESGMLAILDLFIHCLSIIQTTGPIAHGATTVGVTEVPLASNTMQLNTGVRIKATATNAGTVYVGAAGVTAENGFPLLANQEVLVGATAASDVAVIASVAGQEVRWIAN